MFVPFIGTVILVEALGENHSHVPIGDKSYGISRQLAGRMTKLENYYTISASIGKDDRCHTGSRNGKLSKGGQQNPFTKSRSSSANMINSLEWRWR